MHSIKTVSLVSFILGAISAPTTQQHQTANCNSFYFDVEATYERFDIDLTLPTTQAEAQKLLEDIFGGVINPVTGSEYTTATFTHFGKFCYPPAYTAAKNPDTIQVLVHAAWEVEAEYEIAYQPEKYNYIDYATSQGYTVFAYDRLGLGKSQSIDGREVQAPLNTEILTQIVTKLKDGMKEAEAQEKGLSSLRQEVVIVSTRESARVSMEITRRVLQPAGLLNTRVTFEQGEKVATSRAIHGTGSCPL
ncbi:hypothetical protein BT69DRAFT_1342811 [Atractiella rhizophila]|nr:hypothetical protein BT69DRAFT_1342811 [Atractiella rhizophila]